MFVSPAGAPRVCINLFFFFFPRDGLGSVRGRQRSGLAEVGI